MKNQLLNIRVPTILGIGFVILGIVLTTIIVKSQTSLRSKASNSEEPQNVKITNVSDDSFTITYQTDAPTTGSVSYGKGKELGNTELEEPDKEKGGLFPKTIHSLTLKKLSPNTKYNLVIISGQNTFLNNGAPFEIVTAKEISFPSALQNILKGKIILPNGNPSNETLVFLNTENSQLLSTLVRENGEFNFFLKSLRSSDLTSYLKLDENTILKLLATNGPLKSTVLLSLNDVNSIPTITLSNDYDFTHRLVLIPSKSTESKSLGFPVVTTKPTSSKPQILIPKKDQSFTDQKPQFSGTSLPNEKVQIIIRSNENIQTQVIADSNGNWIYRPPTNLSPGEHTITIITRDASGILTTIKQSFTVLAAEAPTSTPTIKPTSTPTLFPTPTPFPSPTITIPTPTFMPTYIPLPTSVSIETKGGLPPTGNPPILLTIGGIITVISGIALFLLTRTIP